MASNPALEQTSHLNHWMQLFRFGYAALRPFELVVSQFSIHALILDKTSLLGNN